jgi:hypothetical protein
MLLYYRHSDRSGGICAEIKPLAIADVSTAVDMTIASVGMTCSHRDSVLLYLCWYLPLFVSRKKQ